MQKLNNACIEIYVISKQDIVVFSEGTKSVLLPEIQSIQGAWKEILKSGVNNKPKNSVEWQIIRSIGEHPSYFYNPLILKFKNDPSGNKYFILFESEKNFPWLELNIILNHAAILDGNLPLHASAVINHGYLYIFCGSSGAGKSTAAFLSSSVGKQTLDEDQIIISEGSSKLYYANGWGYSLQRSNDPIRAIFKIIQSSSDKIQLMPAISTSKFLFLHVLEICGKTPPKSVTEKIFTAVSKISKTVPGYELRFRKSPDFWKLIDAEIPCD